MTDKSPPTLSQLLSDLERNDMAAKVTRILEGHGGGAVNLSTLKPKFYAAVIGAIMIEGSLI
jgi:hypothetical protein